MRLGLVGGSFDPVHYGHLLLGELCREACRLDAVWFIPAHQSPHKPDGASAPPRARVEMLELAIGGNASFSLSRLEIDRGGVSFTYETLQAIHAEDPGRELFLLVGADTLADLPSWREPRVILELALPVAVRRPDSPEPDYGLLAELMSAQRLAEARSLQVEFPQIDLSSRDIRRRVAEGRSIRYQTPRSVERYIHTHGLYRAQ